MKRLCAFALMLAVACTTGCRGDREAQEYAKLLSEVLTTYQEQLNRKMQAEQQSYKELEAAYALNGEIAVKQLLRAERFERSTGLADALLDEGSVLTLSEIQEHLQDYAKLDADATREQLAREVNARAAVIENLEELAVETKKVDTLKAALAELAKPKGKFEQIKDAVAFGKAVQTEFKRLDCDSISTQLDVVGKQVAELKTRLASETDAVKKAVIQGEIDRSETVQKQLTDRKTSLGCGS